MKKAKLEIGRPLKVQVIWYDQVPVPPQEKVLEGEVIGWRESQVIVRVPEYAVIRFWKKNGFEVGNPATDRRGYRIDLEALAESVKPAPAVDGVDVALYVDAEPTGLGGKTIHGQVSAL